MTIDELYMYRCLQLAQAGAGYVTPNPMVGAVLVYNNHIIGEGYHRQYGMPHAEVNCIASVKKEDLHLVNKSVMYVSLEPCAHYGKTPPCADLIIQHRIPKIVIGCRDPFPEVNGKGIEKLLAAGVTVTTGVLEKECRQLNKRFFTFHTQHRPYIILKWAQSSDEAIAAAGGSTVQISNVYSNRLVHRWRSEEAAILVGTRTAMLDDPALTTRLWSGKNPVRLVIDRELKLPASLRLFDETAPTVIFNELRDTVSMDGNNVFTDGRNWFYRLTRDASIIHQLINALYHLRIQSVLVEGGAKLLQSFINENSWNEARIITNETLRIPGGIKAPELAQAQMIREDHLFSDRIEHYINPSVLV